MPPPVMPNHASRLEPGIPLNGHCNGPPSYGIFLIHVWLSQELCSLLSFWCIAHSSIDLPARPCLLQDCW